MPHITINTTVPRVVYAGSGTTFAVPFSLPNAASLRVWANGVPCALSSAPTNATEFSFAGTGAADGGFSGGTITFGGTADGPIIIERAVPLERTSDYPYPSSLLDLRALNTELDTWVWIAQQLQRDIDRALRLDPTDPAASAPTLPPAETRANKVLGFDGTGALQLLGTDPSTYTVPYPGAVPASIAEQLADRLTHVQFGAKGDGVADDTAAIQALFNAAATTGRMAEIGDGTFRITGTVTLPGGASGLMMKGRLLYSGAGGEPALILGDGGATRNGEKMYWGVRVVREVQSSWASEADIGILARNLDASFMEVRQVEGFTIGLRTLGQDRGFEDSTLVLGRIVNNKIGLDIRTGSAAGWNNGIRYLGGHFACGSSVNPTISRYGVRLSREAGAYNLHNSHVFEAPNFELNGTPGTAQRIPFLNETDGRAVIARAMRMEACDAYVARHTGGALDCTYEPVYVGTYAYQVSVLYDATATRAGGVVLPMHQAAVAQHTPRLIAAADNIRALAYRDTTVAAGGVGFERMAVLSGNPSGPPTNLDGFCFPGLTSITLNADDVALPTSRALAFVVASDLCKEFFIGFDGNDLRLVVLQFDAAENLLGSDKTVLFSNQGATWNATACWWEANAVSEDDTLTRLQRVTLHADAKFAVIGARGGNSVDPSQNILRALRLYSAGPYSPRVLFGGNRAWGAREFTATIPWTVPSLASGAVAQITTDPASQASIARARQGDFVDVGFAKDSGFQNGGVVFSGAISDTGRVSISAHNQSAGTINVGAGTAYVRVIKPRV